MKSEKDNVFPLEIQTFFYSDFLNPNNGTKHTAFQNISWVKRGSFVDICRPSKD